MSLGTNIQYLRKINKFTQEQFAEKMNITRQTVSRWESDEVTPELAKLVDMCEVFSCKLDELVRENMTVKNAIYSAVEIKRLPTFKMARYVMISPNPEDDVNTYMHKWAKKSGLLEQYPDVKIIGWDFPFVSQELQTRFHMRGYVAAYVLPDGFTTELPGVEYAENEEANYAMITITEPFIQPFERIPNAYKNIMEYLQANNFKEKQQENIISCFEREYEKDGVTYMNVYIHVDGVTKSDAFSTFN